jgi:hypothetical protein
MKKLILFSIVFLLTLIVSAQKIKLKKGNVLIDGTTWLTYDGCKMFNPVCSLYNTNGDEVVFIKFISVPGEEPITSTNKDGSLTYAEVIFLGEDKKFEIQKTHKKILLDIYKAKVVKGDGTLDESKMNRLLEKYGTPFSDRLNKSSNTIIIKEESNSKSSGSGINIKIN